MGHPAVSNGSIFQIIWQLIRSAFLHLGYIIVPCGFMWWIYPFSSGLFTENWELSPCQLWCHRWHCRLSHQWRQSLHHRDDVIKWKPFLCYWPFVRGIHRSPVNSPHKGQWRGALMLSLICTWINGWVSNGEAGDLKHHHAHYDVSVMMITLSFQCFTGPWAMIWIW